MKDVSEFFRAIRIELVRTASQVSQTVSLLANRIRNELAAIIAYIARQSEAVIWRPLSAWFDRAASTTWTNVCRVSAILWRIISWPFRLLFRCTLVVARAVLNVAGIVWQRLAIGLNHVGRYLGLILQRVGALCGRAVLIMWRGIESALGKIWIVVSWPITRLARIAQRVLAACWRLLGLLGIHLAAFLSRVGATVARMMSLIWQGVEFVFGKLWIVVSWPITRLARIAQRVLAACWPLFQRFGSVLGTVANYAMNVVARVGHYFAQMFKEIFSVVGRIAEVVTLFATSAIRAVRLWISKWGRPILVLSPTWGGIFIWFSDSGPIGDTALAISVAWSVFLFVLYRRHRRRTKSASADSPGDEIISVTSAAPDD